MVQSAIEYVIETRGYYNPPNYYVNKDSFDAYMAWYYLDKDFILAKAAEGKQIDVVKDEAADTTKAE